MKSFLRHCAILISLTLAVTACQEAPEVSAPSTVNFASKPALRLNVAQINVVENYRSSLQAPFVEHTAPQSPAAALKLWAAQRVVAGGGQGMLEITIEDASIKETKLEKKSGFEGFFTDDQEARYDARLQVTMRLYDGVSTISQAESVVQISRWRTINEKATAAQRDAMFAAMVNDMMLQFDSEAEARLRQYFARFLLS